MSHGAVAAVRAVPALSPSLKAGAANHARLAPPSTLYAVGANACSFAMRSVHDTKESFLLVCIGFLEALDSLQTKLHLPTSLVKDLKRRLSKMVDRSLTRPLAAATCEKIQQAERMGERIAESDTWTDVAKPEEVRGFVHWLLAVMKWLNDLAFAGTVGACRRIFILVLRFPGVPTACSLFCRIFEMVERTLRLGGAATPAVTGSTAAQAATQRRAKRAKLDNYMDDSSLTAVVLEYREKECMVPGNINRRIQQFMHFEIPLRSFEATVRLPPSHGSSSARRNGRAHHHHEEQQASVYSPDGEELLDTAHSEQALSSSSSSGGPSSSSPRSIPASPRERRKFELIYSNYFDDVLYQARDKLRLQRAVNITGERNRQIPRFNKHDCDQEVHLICGRNCAVKDGPGLYRSVRGTVPILRNRYVYFEMDLSSGPAPVIASGLIGSSGLLRSGLGGGGDEISACIGIAPRSMLLNTLVGTARNSVGFYSTGQVLVGGQQRTFQAVDRGYSCPSTVGVLVYIHDDSCRNGIVDGADSATNAVAEAIVQFSVNGQAVRGSNGDIVIARSCFPSRVDLYPTVSLHSQGVRVYAQFSSPDIAAFDPSSFMLSPEDVSEVVCLDGFRVPVSENLSLP